MRPDFRLLRDEHDLHAFLGCSADVVQKLLHARDDDLFDRLSIPKKGKRGGTRRVWAVSDGAIADLYKGLARTLNAFLTEHLRGYPSTAAHGYVPGRSTVTNARVHVGATRLLRADIRAFFESISRTQVTKLLTIVGLRPAAAEALASVVVRDGHLPLGLNTSPVLANAVCHPLDERLLSLVRAGRYSRYADDLTFSGRSLPTREQVAAELSVDGFVLADEKWHVARAGRGLYVTGLSLEDRRQPRAPRSMKRRLRQDLYFAAKYGVDEHAGRRGYPSVQSGVNKIHGMIQYVRGVERDIGDRLHEQWTPILQTSGYAVSYEPVGTRRRREILFLLDESVVDGPSGRTMIVCLAVVEDINLVRAVLSRFLRDRAADPFGATDREMLARGLHWNELSQDDRTRVTECLRTVPFRAFVAFGRLPAEDRATYDQTYRTLLAKLPEGRFVRYDNCVVEVKAEENSKVRTATLRDVVSSSYGRLEQQRSRRPVALPTHQIVSKGADDALPLPDLVLGIFVDYARAASAASVTAGASTKKRQPGAQAESRFDQVRDRVRAIYDLDRGTVYSRRRPFSPGGDRRANARPQILAHLHRRPSTANGLNRSVHRLSCVPSTAVPSHARASS